MVNKTCEQITSLLPNRRLLQFQWEIFHWNCNNLMYTYMIHITCPVVPFGIMARNERIWYNKIYTHLNGIICKHNYHLVVWKHLFVHTKNVIQYLCIATSFQKVYWYNNFQDKNVTYPSQATHQQAHTRYYLGILLWREWEEGEYIFILLLEKQGFSNTLCRSVKI